MENQSFSEDLQRYLALAWHWAWLLALAGAFAGVVAYYVNSRMTPIYQSSATFLLNEAPLNKSTSDYTSLVTSERLAETYALMMGKEQVLAGVVERLGLDIDPAGLKTSVFAQHVPNTLLIMVRATNTNPQLAADIANAVGEVFAEQSRNLQSSRYDTSKRSLQDQIDRMQQQIEDVTTQLTNLGYCVPAQSLPAGTMATPDPNWGERQRLEATLAQYRQTLAYYIQSLEQVRLAEAQSTTTLVPVELAKPSYSPIRPRTLRNTGLAGIIGVLASAAVIYLIEMLDDTLKGQEDVTRMGLPILGVIAQHVAENELPITASQPRTPVSEAFRSLRTNIQYVSVDKPLNTILVTSPSPEDGKSTIVANLGVILSQGGKKVTILDADMRRPKVHKIFNLPNRIGTSDLFVNPQGHLDGTLQPTEVGNLTAITSGHLPPNPAELLGSEKMGKVLDLVHAQVDTVIIDSPPILAVTDSTVLAPRVDGVLLVVKPGSTKLAAFRQAVDQLKRVGTNILGVVLNGVQLKGSRYRYGYYKGYYYSYYHYYGDKKKKIKRADQKTKE